MSADASEVMRRALRLERARSKGHPNPLDYAINGGKLPRKPLVRLAPFDPPDQPEERQQGMFAGLCPLCGARTKNRYCHAHSWAD